MNRRDTMSSAVAIALAIVATPALGQAPDNGQALKEQDGQDIIVTARKRQESILNVPVVETALSKETLDRYVVSDLFAVATKVPGLLIGSGTGAFGTQVSMRGVGTTTLNSAIDQSISLNIDGIQLTQGLSYKVGFFDMAQVEVMKGPQALFFGKASPAGVISINTADPGQDFEVIARAGYEFEAKEKREELILSGPISDTLGLRLSTMVSDADGFFKLKTVGTPQFGGVAPSDSRAPETNEWILRGTAVWKPSDRFSARLKANYDHLHEEHVGLQIASCPDGTGLVPGGVFQYLAGEDCKYDRTSTWVELDPAAYPGLRNNGVSYRDTRQHFGTLELNYDVLEGLALTSVTGYYKVKNEGFQNSQTTTGPGPINTADTNFSRRDVTQEVRLTSDFKDAPLNFVVGGFYQDALMKFRNNSIGNITQPRSAIDPRPILPLAIQGNHRVNVDAVSAFGQLIWNVTPQLELAGGVRWTHEKRSATMVNTNPFSTIPLGPVALGVSDISSKRLSPEVSLTYKPTDDLTIFGSFKEAAKSGSFNVSNIVAAGTDTSFGDEKVRGGEVGLKGRLLDRRLTFNLAGYYYKFKDLQVGANEVLPSGALVIRTINAASAKTYGLDFDTSYRPAFVEGLTLNGAVNWNIARFLKFDNAQCWGGQTIADGCNRLLNTATGRFNAQDLSGRPLTRAPEWTATFGFDYEFPIGGDMTMSIGSSTQYASKYYTNITLRDDMLQKGYFKTDLNVSLKGPQDSYEVALIGKNLNNEITTGNCTNAAFASGGRVGSISGGATRNAAGVDELACQPDRGREVWLRLTLRPALFGK